MHDCAHGEHTHQHHHHGIAEGIPPSYTRKLKWVMGLSVFYMFLQVAGGYFSGSLALMAEAGHKLADAASIGLALLAAWFASLPASSRKTFGYHRAEILAAMINGMALFIVAGVILSEAFERFYGHGHHHIEGELMFVVAAVGLTINIIAARILLPAKDLNLNVKGALFHVITDILGSIGTLLTGLGILFFNWMWLDTVLSIIISLLVMRNGFHILTEAVHILMEFVPKRIDVHAIKHFIQEYPGVKDVHDLHIWTITTGKDALLAHVQVSTEAFKPETGRALEHQLREIFELCHITLQLEPEGFEEDEILF